MIVGAGNFTTHPTREDLLAEIKTLAKKLEIQLPEALDNPLLPMKDLYQVRLKLQTLNWDE